MIATFDDLKAAVDSRNSRRLVMCIDLGTGDYSAEYEAARKAYEQAKALGGTFLGGDVEAARERMESLAPEPLNVWAVFKPIPTATWTRLSNSQKQITAVEQYEKVLPDSFVGLYGDAALTVEVSTDWRCVSSVAKETIFNGGTLANVVSEFMAWQNAGGEVTVNPTK